MKLIDKKQAVILDIGCGPTKQEGTSVIGIDRKAYPGVDIQWDIEKYPWPLPSECASMAVASHIAEHINPAGGNFILWMNEIWRLLKPGGQLVVIAPYCTSAGMFMDPTHCNFISESTFCYFDPEDGAYGDRLYGVYGALPWRLKVNNWSVDGVVEAVLVKRPIEATFKVDGDFIKTMQAHTKRYAKKEKGNHNDNRKGSKGKDAFPPPDKSVQMQETKI